MVGHPRLRNNRDPRNWRSLNSCVAGRHHRGSALPRLTLLYDWP